MKYEFHVGDYVESKGGLTGFISSVGEAGCCVLWNLKTAKVNIGYDFEELLECLVRLGKYDFTKKDKIEPLEYNNSPDWDDSLLLDKINELVDAVNELRKDKNE